MSQTQDSSVRSARNTSQRAVIAVFGRLRAIVAAPGAFAEDLGALSALRSQGGLARWTGDWSPCRGMSLNTLKSASEAVLLGGFPELDRMRIAAKEAVRVWLDHARRPNKATKSSLLARIHELEKENLAVRQDLLRLTAAFSKSQAQAQRYAQDSKNADIQAKCVREQHELRVMLWSLESPVIVATVAANDK